MFCNALAQDICGPIGNSDESAVMRRQDHMFYLNIAHPAPCSGNITSWRVCYYGPDSIHFSSYWATYAVYRRVNSDGSDHYEMISSMFRAVRATGLLAAIDSTGVIDGSIQAGDVIGACVFDPEDSENFNRRQLDIVGEIDGQSLLGMSSSGCTTDSLPLNIPIYQLSTVSSSHLYLYANIGNQK